MPVRYTLMFASFVSLAAIAFPSTAAPSLSWRLENPFRLFRNPADFERLRVPAGTDLKTWFAGIGPQVKGDFLPYRRTYWDPAGGENSSGQYEDGYLRPKSHRIVLTWRDAPANATCDWQVGTQQPWRAPCASTTATVPSDAGQPQQATGVVTVRANNGTEASTTVKIRDWLILGLGDSYSAGEGSPDRPSEPSLRHATEINDPFLPQETRGIRRVWFPLRKEIPQVAWWDNECNRSLLSWQAMAALRLASDLAREGQQEGAAEQHAVTFASYACSGAEFYDGIFTPQASPPGVLKRYATADETYRAPASVQHSQLFAAARDLCADGEPIRSFHGSRRVEMFGCAAPRRPDAILLSVGGNDAGFAPAIMHTILPLPGDGNSAPGATMLGWMHGLLGTVDAAEAQARMQNMSGYYTPLADALQSTLQASRDSVIFMAYPNSIMRPTAMRKGGPGDYCGLEMRAGMEAARELASPPAKFWWHFWATQAEMADAGAGIVVRLQETIKGALPDGWRYADGHLAAFEQHGMCADAVEPEADSAKQPTDALRGNVMAYGLPRYTVNARKRLEPLGSLHWHPYDAAQRRWVRTPNDSLRTQTRDSLKKSIGGSFHPTGAGYAAMADAAYEQLSRLINERRRDAR
jgi:lysophospholipase L1-like esterase